MSESTVTNVLIGCTGSVASLKIPELVARFHTSERPLFNVKIMTTQNAQHFFSVADLPADVPMVTDADEWSTWQGRGDPVLHIELNRWADVMVLAPLDANSMAKIANVSSKYSLKELPQYSMTYPCCRVSVTTYYSVLSALGQ